jgi:N-acetylmuramoyl-L-alanine amidase
MMISRLTRIDALKALLIPGFVIITWIVSTSFINNPASRKYTLKTIVIDPGHGGSDPGCGTAGVWEKNVALSISLKLGKLLKDSFPDLKVIFTRTTDKFVDLNERAVLANKVKADLFLCVHCNTSSNATAYGTETYAMGLYKAEGNLDVAKRENDVILLEKDYKEKYEGYDPNSPESHIIFSMYQNAYLDKSLDLSSRVEGEFTKSRRFSRGVKQAGFLVLWKCSMPSILCETGFISNPKERAYLTNDSCQGIVARNLFDALKVYKLNCEK